jgi:hypothetical protein
MLDLVDPVWPRGWLGSQGRNARGNILISADAERQPCAPAPIREMTRLVAAMGSHSRG